ncbi:MAG: SDR family oxidoreductase [Patescibacteria group bacterium]|mgnify:CR=1 FL=1
MNHQPTIVLTGSTGIFGRFLVPELLRYNIKLILLVRGISHEDAKTRVQSIISNNENNIEVFCSDLTKKYLGLSESEYKDIASRTTHILHSAASTRFNLPLEESRIHNVKTTEEILIFAKQCKNLIRFGFLSTALVAGRRTGIIKEDELEHNKGFNNSYQQTKYEAEMLVHAQAKNFPIVIFRAPLVISSDVSVSHKGPPNFLVVLISLVAKGLLPYVPGTKDSTMDIVSSEDTAHIVIKLMLKDNLSHVTYHITNGDNVTTTHMLHQMVERKIGKKIPIEYCGNLQLFLKRVEEESSNKPEMRAMYKKAESFLMEPVYPKIFDNSNTLSELNITKIGEDPSEILKLMFSNKLWTLSE